MPLCTTVARARETPLGRGKATNHAPFHALSRRAAASQDNKVVDPESFARCAGHLHQLIRETRQFNRLTRSNNPENQQNDRMLCSDLESLDTVQAGLHDRACTFVPTSTSTAGTVGDACNPSYKTTSPSIRLGPKPSFRYGSKKATKLMDEEVKLLLQSDGECKTRRHTFQDVRSVHGE